MKRKEQYTVQRGDAEIRIDTDKIKPWTREDLTATLWKAIDAAWSNPEIRAGYEEWKRQRAAAEAAV